VIPAWLAAVLRVIGIRRAAATRLGEAIDEAIDDPDTAPELHLHPDPCMKPPRGWRCTRKRGHAGPCAAVQQTERVVPASVPGGTLIIKAAPAGMPPPPRPPRKGKP
jgi:hypothetical protein